MPTLLPWDLINPVEATAFAREVLQILPDNLDDPLAEVLPERQVNDVRARSARASRTNSTARFRAWNAESPLGQRDVTMTVDEVRFPPISEKMPLTEAERLELFLAETSGTNPAIARNLLEAAYDDIENQVRRIRNRQMLARWDVVLDGKFTLANENGLTLETDWGFLSGQMPTPVGALWSNRTTSTPIDDEILWTQYMESIGGGTPRRVFMRRARLLDLQNNAQYRQALYPGLSLANIPALSVEQVNQVRIANGLAPITIVEKQLVVEGVTTPLLPATKVVMVGADVGETQWGVTPDALEMRRTFAEARLELPGLVAGTYYSTDPWTRWTKVGGAGFPVLGNTAAVVTATVA